jgi:hypothetical protein
MRVMEVKRVAMDAIFLFHTTSGDISELSEWLDWTLLTSRSEGVTCPAEKSGSQKKRF